MSVAHEGFGGSAALVPGELRGYRRFRLAEDGLYPAVHADLGPWSGAVQQAQCAAGGEHAAPARDCGCGLYGWYYPVDAGEAGFGTVTAVVAARGRSILGDHGFRAASARIEAVALPMPLAVRPRAAARTRRRLARQYPRAAVYSTRRRMLRDYPPHDLRALGVPARPSARRRYKHLTLGVWALGLTAPWILLVLPRETVASAGPAVWLLALGGFLLWQALLVWLVARWVAPPRARPSR